MQKKCLNITMTCTNLTLRPRSGIIIKISPIFDISYRSKVLTKDNPLPRADHTFVNIKESGFLFGGSNSKRDINDLGDLQEINLGKS